MADPFSVGAGIVGVLGVAIQISEMVFKFGLDWKNAPEDVMAFKHELQNLQITLAEMQSKLFSNPSFEAAFQGNSSALLSHVKADDASEDSIKEAFKNCQAELKKIVNKFQAKEGRPGSGWDRVKDAFVSKETERAISHLQRRCRNFDQLLSIDTAALTAHTNLEVKEVRKENQGWHSQAQNRNILRWLSALSFEEKHRDILSKHHPGTGQWLLDADEFKAWRNGQLDSSPNLWCPGIPGAGKTVLAAKVINHLQQVFGQDNVAVLYIYCDYKDQLQQTDRNLFSSLAKQCILQQTNLPTEAEALYSQCSKGETSPSSAQCLELLACSMKHFRRTYIVLDALDEHKPSREDGFTPRIPLLCELIDIQHKIPGRCTIFITSREIYSIQEQLPDRVRLDIRAQDEDIRSYIASRVCDDAKFAFARECRADTRLANEIVEKLVEKAQGMFLLPRLHLDRLGNQTRVSKVRKTLDDLPSKLDDTYEDAMYRIQHQHEEYCELALKVLSWISKARRPLQVEEVQHAISVEVGDNDVEDGPLEAQNLLVSVCAGLVTVDTESRNFRLVHFTVEEFFKRNHYKWFSDAETTLAKTCLTYLSFDTFGQGVCDTKSDWEARVEKYVLLEYAAQNWMAHLGREDTLSPELHTIASRLLRNESEAAAARQASFLSGILRFHPKYMVSGLPGIHLVVEMACMELKESWQASDQDADPKILDNGIATRNAGNKMDLAMVSRLLSCTGDVDGKAQDGSTALMVAARFGWYDGVKLLLDQGADAHAVDHRFSTCLHHIADHRGAHSQSKASKCIDLLLKVGLDVEARDGNGRTPLMIAICRGCPGCIEDLQQGGAAINADTTNTGRNLLMLAAGYCPDQVFLELLLNCGLDVNAVDQDGQTALMMATRIEAPEEPIKLLLSFGAHIDAADNYGDTALIMAVKRYIDPHKGAEILLQSGADVNAANHRGETALMAIIGTGNFRQDKGLVKLLLQSGADANAVDARGRTALMISIERGCVVEKIRLLLQFKAHVNAVDARGRTALIYASRCIPGVESIELLLQSGADVNATDEEGATALMKLVKFSPNSETIKLLLQSGANVNAVDKERSTVLMTLVENSANSETIKLLLQSGANVNAVNESGATALMKLVQFSADSEAIKLLLQSEANVDSADVDGETAVMKLVRSLLNFCSKDFPCDISLGRRKDIFPKHKCPGNEEPIVILRAVRTWLLNSMRSLLSRGLSEQNRKDAQALAASYAGADSEVNATIEKVTQILSMPPDKLSAATLTSREKQDLDLMPVLIESGAVRLWRSFQPDRWDESSDGSWDGSSDGSWDVD